MNWRYYIGLTLLALASLMVLAGIGLVLAGQPGGKVSGWAAPLLAGPPEILCLLAAAILGKENYQVLAPKLRRALRRPDQTAAASRLRYYSGLAGCLFNGVPLALYAYAPELMPGGSTKMSILIIADLVFIGSLLFAGGELWEKIRRIFVWDGDSVNSK